MGTSWYTSSNGIANGLYKAEFIDSQKPWTSSGEVELAILRWADYWTTKPLHEASDYATHRK